MRAASPTSRAVISEVDTATTPTDRSNCPAMSSRATGTLPIPMSAAMSRMLASPPELSSPPTGPDFNVERVRAEAEADRLLRLRALIPEQARQYCTVETAVVEGGVSRQILNVAKSEDDDLIVLGVHGRNVLDLAVFGSNAKDVVALAQCPVLLVPAGPRRAALRAAS